MEDNNVPVSTQNQDTIDVSEPSQPPKPQFQAPPKKKSDAGKKILGAFIIILLVVAAGVAGYTYAKNQAQKETDAKVAELQSQIDSLKKSAEEINNHASARKTYVLKTQKLAFDYPSSWVLVSKATPANSDGFGPLEEGTIKNPATGLTIKFTSGGQGIGGGCDKPVPDYITVVDPMPNLKLKNNVNYVERIIDDNGKFYVGFGISDSIKSTGTATVCPNTAYLVAELGGSTSKGGGLLDFGSGLTLYEKTFKTKQEAQAFLTSDDFATAKKIVQSLRSTD